MKKRLTLVVASLVAIITPIVAFASNGEGCCSSLCPFC